jgi:hypothetical protein
MLFLEKEQSMIYLRMVGCCLRWAVSGAVFGLFAGVCAGGVLGAIYAVIFVERNGGVTGLMFGAMTGWPQGAVTGGVAFLLASLTRIGKPSLLSAGAFFRAARSAWNGCFAGAFAGALTGALGWSLLYILTVTAVWPLSSMRAGEGFYWGCQAGFNLGLFVGALAPGWTDRLIHWRRQAKPAVTESSTLEVG